MAVSHGRTRYERRPIDASLKLVVRFEGHLEVERELRGTMGVQMRYTLLGFIDAGNMSGWHPP